MTWNLHGTHAQEGDLAQLAGLRHKNFIIRLTAGAEFQTHRGVLQHNDLIGLPWGSQVFSHNGSPFFLLQPPLAELLHLIPRNTQILYAKDIGFILVTMGIGPGQHVLEAGSGSGAMTTALAYAVGPQGHVSSYEVHPERVRMATRNLERVGLQDRVTIHAQDIAAGFEERGVDALFLDLPNPYDFLPQVREALRPGGFFGCILPTTNQVIRMLTALRLNRFAFIDVSEIMLRHFKPEADTFRPVDRMVAHTGYLIFGRPILVDETRSSAELLVESGLDEADDGVPVAPNETPQAG